MADLTVKQRQLLVMLAQGRNFKEIAVVERVSSRSIYARTATLYRKLGCERSPANAVHIAWQKGILP